MCRQLLFFQKCFNFFSGTALIYADNRAWISCIREPGMQIRMFDFIQIFRYKASVFPFLNIIITLSKFYLSLYNYVVIPRENDHQAITRSLSPSRTVVLKLVGSIEPNRCHASIHRTLDYNQERIQKILEGGCSFELG